MIDIKIDERYKTDIKWKQSKEGLQGGLQEIIDTPLVSLLF